MTGQAVTSQSTDFPLKAPPRLSTLARAAARYAARGWHVFPLQPGAKQPLVHGGFKSATTDPVIVDAWWRGCRDANIGLAPAPSGLIVFDIDGQAAEAIAGELGLCAEPTLTVATGRRYLPSGHPKHYAEARHLYFTTDGLPAGVLAHLGNPMLRGVLEVKAAAGYVILPPSIHPDSGARYAWEVKVAPIPVPPRAASALAVAKEVARRGAVEGGPIPEGARRPTLFRFAGALRRQGCSDAGILAALRAENASRCQPPLAEADVIATAEGVRRYPVPEETEAREPRPQRRRPEWT